jgi:hypothetical protein
VGSDRARISFDRTREYRSLIAQQGRVTLEADVNEQAVIASEALRLETIDIIGPTGTPDGGYLVSVDANGNLIVGAGIMYVGGWRMRFFRPVEVAKQPEWIDQPIQTWAEQPQGNYVVALLVTEQEVQAIEDTALREVALGGPDTAARTRLMQHIVAISTKYDNCAAVLKDWDSYLKPFGLALQPNTFALEFNAALQVSFYPPAGPADPCCPPAQGGYLGADNQLVRVTVTSYDSAAHKGTLLWGWNNASFLYRAKLVDPTANPLVLALSPAPVDAAHTPQINQVVEVLRSTMMLGNPLDQNFIAAPEGKVIALASSGTVFDPTNNQLTLPAGTTLTTDYSKDANPLFVRLWQTEVPFTDGTPAQLDQVSGLTVTVHMDALPTGSLEARPFWDFAVRPNTPQQVYPQRYLQSPQGPTGPRRWLTDLAIVELALRGGSRVIADCRVTFPSHGDDCGCCGITLSPAEVTARGGLQAVVDAQAKNGQTLSLRPGVYVLEAPLVLSRAHAGFSLVGCEPGRARLTVDPAKVASFTTGMINIKNTSNITIQGLVLNQPLAPETSQTTPIGTFASGRKFITDMTIGIGITNATSIVIEDCQFLYPSPQDNADKLSIFFGAAIHASENCTGLRVLRNRFESPGGGQSTATSFRVLMGLWMTPTAAQTGKQAKASAILAVRSAINLPRATDRLDDVEITDNRFTGLTMAVLVIAQMGMIRCTDNRVANGCGGFWFLDSDLGANVAFGQAALANERQATGAKLSDAATVRQFMQPSFLANAVNFSSAFFQPAAATADNATVSDETRTVLTADYATKGNAAYATFLGVPSTPAVPTDSVRTANLSATPPTRAKKPASPKATAAPTPDYTNAVTAYNLLANVGIARELAGTDLVPALYIRDNDLTLIPYDSALENAASLQGIHCMLKINAAAGAFFLSGNRVEVPNGYSIAVSTEWSSNTIITGNLFNQLGVEDKAAEPCAILITTERALSAITGNVVNADWKVSPPRFAIPATTDWKFLNTVI